MKPLSFVSAIKNYVSLLIVFLTISFTTFFSNGENEKLDFKLYDVYGREVHSSDYLGVPVFFEFGACW